MEKGIDLVLYRGGTLGEYLFYTLAIECRNLEAYGVRKYTEHYHGPLDEVNFFQKEFLRIVDGWGNKEIQFLGEKIDLNDEWEKKNNFAIILNFDLEMRRPPRCLEIDGNSKIQ